jgi:hypothetical protein
VLGQHRNVKLHRINRIALKGRVLTVIVICLVIVLDVDKTIRVVGSKVGTKSTLSGRTKGSSTGKAVARVVTIVAPDRAVLDGGMRYE